MITGGSQGMGRGLAKQLAQKGANVVIVARTQKKLDEALKYISVSVIDLSVQMNLLTSSSRQPPRTHKVNDFLQSAQT